MCKRVRGETEDPLVSYMAQEESEFHKALSHMGVPVQGDFHPYRSSTGWVMMNEYLYHSLLDQISTLQGHLIARESMSASITGNYQGDRRKP